MPPPPSALADIPSGSVTSPRGFTAAAAHAGLKADGAPDVALLVSATSCATAGVFTKNALRAAPVVYDADLLAERPGRMRAVAMNARVANACTGAPGLAAARSMAQAAEQAAALPPRTALVLSTGVIGVPLPVEQVADGLRAAAGRLTPDGGPEAARAIMTTDTRPKHCAVRFETPAGIVTVGGIAKGAGMIHPDMATLLAVLTTDAVGEPAGLQPLLRRVADRSFNAISVDGDTSTNDTVLLLAGGASGVDPSRDGALWKTFEDAMLQVARTLALAIVSDGEGASKLGEIHVVGGGGVDLLSDAGVRPDQRRLHLVGRLLTAWSCWCPWLPASSQAWRRASSRASSWPSCQPSPSPCRPPAPDPASVTAAAPSQPRARRGGPARGACDGSCLDTSGRDNAGHPGPLHR